MVDSEVTVEGGHAVITGECGNLCFRCEWVLGYKLFGMSDAFTVNIFLEGHVCTATQCLK